MKRFRKKFTQLVEFISKDKIKMSVNFLESKLYIFTKDQGWIPLDSILIRIEEKSCQINDLDFNFINLNGFEITSESSEEFRNYVKTFMSNLLQYCLLTLSQFLDLFKAIDEFKIYLFNKLFNEPSLEMMKSQIERCDENTSVLKDLWSNSSFIEKIKLIRSVIINVVLNISKIRKYCSDYGEVISLKCLRYELIDNIDTNDPDIAYGIYPEVYESIVTSVAAIYQNFITALLFHHDYMKCVHIHQELIIEYKNKFNKYIDEMAFLFGDHFRKDVHKRFISGFDDETQKFIKSIEESLNFKLSID